MNKNVRKLTEGAMMVALVAVFLILDRQLAGLVEALLFWVIPLPMLLYTAKYGFKDGFWVTISMFFVSFMFATPYMVVSVLGSSIIGLVYGAGVKNHWGTIKNFIITFVITTIYYYITMIVFASFFGYDLMTEYYAIVEVLGSTEIFNNLGETQVGIMGFAITGLVPLLLSFLQTIVTHLLGIIMLKRFKIANIEAPNLFNIKLSQKTGILLAIICLGSWILVTLSNQLGLSANIMRAVWIVFLVGMMIFGFLGVICVMTIAMARGNKLIANLAIILAIPFIPIFVFIGVLDSITDIRIDLSRR